MKHSPTPPAPFSIPIICKIVITLLLLLLVRAGTSQGFLNFDFESANLTGYSQGNIVPASNAFPGWAVSATYIPYDDISLSGESISIMDAKSPFFTTSIQGTYYALFTPANSPSSTKTISLSQTGMIPSGT